MSDIVQLTEKLAQADIALQKAVQYVANVQPKLDAYNEVFDKFVKRAHQSVGILVGRGLVPQRKANELIDKLASDVTVAFDVIEKVAEMIVPQSLGSTSNVKVAADTMDPFERLCLGGAVNDGMVV